jgi:predicted permease
MFGVAPAFQSTGIDLAPSLKEGTGVSARTRNRLARHLVVGQVALSLVLLAGSALFLRSLANLMDVDPGFDKHDVLLIGIDPGPAGYQVDARLDSMMERVEQRLASIPGVHGASFAYFVFNGGGWSTDDIAVPGRTRSETDPTVDLNIVGPQYLDVMKMPIVLGRGLSPRDNAASRKVAVINETMARVYFADRSPVGQTFSVYDDEREKDAQWQNVEVVGVVKDAKYMDLDEKQMPAAFFPHAQHLRNFLFSCVARYSGDAGTLVPAVRNAVAEVDPNLPVGDITTLAAEIDDAVVNRRAVAQLSTLFGLLAAFLACIGIYGVMSCGIARRTNEFGVRMALGAQKHDVMWMVLREALRLGLTGVVIGLVLALASGRLVAGLLFGLKPYDPLAIGLATLAMISVALCAGYLPAQRATRIDPMVALRNE